MHCSASTLLWIPKPDQTGVAAVSISKTDYFASLAFILIREENIGNIENALTGIELMGDRDVFVSGSLRAHFPTSVFEKNKHLAYDIGIITSKWWCFSM